MALRDEAFYSRQLTEVVGGLETQFDVGYTLDAFALLAGSALEALRLDLDHDTHVLLELLAHRQQRETEPDVPDPRRGERPRTQPGGHLRRAARARGRVRGLGQPVPPATRLLR
jgi:hypothetical protein